MEAMETYIITEEQMANVSTYVPLRAKTEWVQVVAPYCIDKVEVTASQDNGGEDLAMPPMYKENTERKSQFLMGVLVRLYLHGTWEIDESDRKEEINDDVTRDYRTWLIPIDEYDKWAGGHIWGQIDKYRSNKDLRNRCYDLLNDYKDLERRLNAEIYDTIRIMNDPATRQITAQQIQMTPEFIENTINELKMAQEALQMYQDGKQTEEQETNG